MEGGDGERVLACGIFYLKKKSTLEGEGAPVAGATSASRLLGL